MTNLWKLSAFVVAALIIGLLCLVNWTTMMTTTSSPLSENILRIPDQKQQSRILATTSTNSLSLTAAKSGTTIASAINITKAGSKNPNAMLEDEEITVDFNRTEYILNQLPKAPIPTDRSCRLYENGASRLFKTLVFVDNCYFTLFSNWYHHFLDVCGETRKKQLEIVCMDTEVVLSLLHLNLTCSTKSFVMPNYQSYRRKQAMVWIKRLEVIIHFLEEGVDLLLTDTDAIWRFDPFLQIQQHLPYSNVIASRGNFPATVYVKYGATVCMGFAYFKSSLFTVTLMKAVLQEMKYDRPDDQYAINMVLDKWNIQYPTYMGLEYNTEANYGHILVANQRNNITLLPHDKFIRNCTRLPKSTNVRFTKESIAAAQSAVSSAVIAHCVFTAGNAYTKFLSIRAYHLWHLDMPMIDPATIIPTPGCIVRAAVNGTSNSAMKNKLKDSGEGNDNDNDNDGGNSSKKKKKNIYNSRNNNKDNSKDNTNDNENNDNEDNDNEDRAATTPNYFKKRARKRSPASAWTFVGQAAQKVGASLDEADAQERNIRRMKKPTINSRQEEENKGGGEEGGGGGVDENEEDGDQGEVKFVKKKQSSASNSGGKRKRIRVGDVVDDEHNDDNNNNNNNEGEGAEGNEEGQENEEEDEEGGGWIQVKKTKKSGKQRGDEENEDMRKDEADQVVENNPAANIAHTHHFVANKKAQVFTIGGGFKSLRHRTPLPLKNAPHPQPLPAK